MKPSVGPQERNCWEWRSLSMGKITHGSIVTSCLHHQRSQGERGPSEINCFSHFHFHLASHVGRIFITVCHHESFLSLLSLNCRAQHPSFTLCSSWRPQQFSATSSVDRSALGQARLPGRALPQNPPLPPRPAPQTARARRSPGPGTARV